MEKTLITTNILVNLVQDFVINSIKKLKEVEKIVIID